jgi:hypothetical protein
MEASVGAPEASSGGSSDAEPEAGPEASSPETGTDAAEPGDASAPVPGDASATGQHAVLIWGYGEHLATPAPTAPLEPLDVQMKALLEAKGFVVDLAEDKISPSSSFRRASTASISRPMEPRTARRGSATSPYPGSS